MEYIHSDSHVHIGYFERGKRHYYFDPIDTIKELYHIGISKIAVMSTTICKGFTAFEESSKEIDKIITSEKCLVYPILWFLPSMLSKNKSYIFDRQNWCAVKIHPRAQYWDPKGQKIQEAVCCIKERKLPIIIHTSLYPNYCEVKDFKYLINNNKDATFILAHGRPIKQALDILIDCKNVYLDTAYMPFEDIFLLALRKFSGRLLFGSDYPIDMVYYPNKNRIKRYEKNLYFCSIFLSSGLINKNFDIIFNGRHFDEIQ